MRKVFNHSAPFPVLYLNIINPAVLNALHDEKETEANTTGAASNGLQKYQELMRLPIVHFVAAFVLVYVGAEVRIFYANSLLADL
jgi:fucose permease